ncbi:MAG: FtsQ-type POTRA domain-containing protein [Clostridiales bacterium]|nr:FtsQ-type POTRA domain-containing protein [Clostridiales bacterium]
MERTLQVAKKDTSFMYRLRLRRLKHAFFTGLGLILIAFAGFSGYTLANSSFFDLEEIRVEGNAAISRDEIVALSGLRMGDNLLKVSGGRVAESISVQPYIKEIGVKRVFPGRVEIRVGERTPMALVGADGQYLVLDESGYCLTEAALVAAESWTLPCIRCSSEGVALEPGRQTQDKGILAALALIKKLDPFFLENILEFDAPSAEKLAVINIDGLPVYFGPPEDLDRKLQNYEELLIKNREKCNASTLNYVDIRYDTQITLSWK